MEHLLNPNVKEIEISGIRKFSNLVAQHDNVISLTIGQPDFFTPHHVKAAAKKAIDENATAYTPNAGGLELRQAVQLYMKKKADLNYEAETEIIVTTGQAKRLTRLCGRFYLRAMKLFSPDRYIRATNRSSACRAPFRSMWIRRHTDLS